MPKHGLHFHKKGMFKKSVSTFFFKKDTFKLHRVYEFKNLSPRFFIKKDAFEFLALAVILNQYRVTSLLIWLQLYVTNTAMSIPSFRVNLEI